MDVHPSDQKVVTGGAFEGGGSAGLVAVWPLTALLKPNAPSTSAASLCRLEFTGKFYICSVST